MVGYLVFTNANFNSFYFLGGDALVLARHLSLMKFKPDIYYPKRTDKPLYNNLVTQCTLMDIPFLDSCPDILTVTKYRLIADGLFGFSFKPPVRDSKKHRKFDLLFKHSLTLTFKISKM